MHLWTDSWAFWAGILSAVAAVAAVLTGIAANRRPSPAPAGSTMPSGAAPPLIEGRAEPIVMMEAPATNRECVQYSERVEASVPPGDLHSDDGGEAEEIIEETVDQNIVNRAVGAFLVVSDAGQAIVWPALNDVRYVEGWTSRENDDENRTSYEKVLPKDTIVRVFGTPGMHSQMMEEMVERAEDLPDDLLRELQTRPDLPSLPCYWPRGGEFWVEEEGAELDEGDDEAGLGLHLAFAAVASVLSAVLLACAYKGLL